jgi:putative transposase
VAKKKKQKGSKNRKKEILKLKKKYRKLKNMRKDFLDKVFTAIAKHYDIIIIENLNVQGMQQNHHIAKSIGDVSFYNFKQKLLWKADRFGKNLVEIGRFDPSSKLYLRCGNLKKDL